MRSTGAPHSRCLLSLAYGLTDSPVGLAGWIVEKWRARSDCDGDAERCFSRDELLTMRPARSAVARK
jgi:hypothetical protein